MWSMNFGHRKVFCLILCETIFFFFFLWKVWVSQKALQYLRKRIIGGKTDFFKFIFPESPKMRKFNSSSLVKTIPQTDVRKKSYGVFRSFLGPFLENSPKKKCFLVSHKIRQKTFLCPKFILHIQYSQLTLVSIAQWWKLRSYQKHMSTKMEIVNNETSPKNLVLYFTSF